ncbi:hypothetical protein Tco_1385673 [Tanacetum coccineum]
MQSVVLQLVDSLELIKMRMIKARLHWDDASSPFDKGMGCRNEEKEFLNENIFSSFTVSTLLIEDIKQTDVYKPYDDAYNGVEVPMTQPSPVVSTQGTNRTLSSPRSPKPKRTPKKMKDKVIGESSEPKKSHVIAESAKEGEEKSNADLVEEVVDVGLQH